MRILTDIEEDRLKVLTKNSISLTLIEPTATGLKKSIMDATGPLRNYLKENGFHDYELQQQGPENKIIIQGLIYEQFQVAKSNVSLYRPNTKKGDPRIWFSGLTKYAAPNDILVVVCFNGIIHIFNLTQLPIEKLIDSAIANPLKELVNEISRIENAIANELLMKLRKIEHTRRPITSQFDILIEQGIITLDHLIKRNSNGRVVEKGPLFKIKPKGMNLLFPPSEKYCLVEN